jgi:hypothetical protein
MASTWRAMLAPATSDEVLALAAEAGALATTVGERLGLDRPGSESPPVAAMTEAAASFMFPDELWSRILYDLIVGARDVPDTVDARVASLVPVYFGRVASFVIENRELTTDRAEATVERQAREFERLKPYLLTRWDEAARTDA